jgi:hypothetical protein
MMPGQRAAATARSLSMVDAARHWAVVAIATNTSPANALGQLGQLEQVHEALSRRLSLSPGLCREQAMRASTGFHDEAVFQHYLEGLRKAD